VNYIKLEFGEMQRFSGAIVSISGTVIRGIKKCKSNPGRNCRNESDALGLFDH
jgi:hypothetical protein